MLQVKNSKANTISDASVNNCLVFTSVTDSECLNTVSPLFTTCTGDYCVSSDTSANFGANSLLNQPIASWLDANDDINETGQAALTGAGWNGSNIAEWAWSEGGTPPPPTTAINTLYYNSVLITDVKYYNGSALIPVELVIDGTTVWREGE